MGRWRAGAGDGNSQLTEAEQTEPESHRVGMGACGGKRSVRDEGKGVGVVGSSDADASCLHFHPVSSAKSLICCVKPGLGLRQMREAKLHWPSYTFYTDNCQHDIARYLKNVFAYLLCTCMCVCVQQHRQSYVVL